MTLEPAGRGPEPRVLESLAGDPLTPRELEVLRLAAGGLQAGQIAEHLVISRGTVKTHLQHIYAKLEAHNRTAAVVAAMRAGLID